MPIYGSAGKRGYLNEDFRLFHLKDSRAQRLDYHYHEFDKLILFLNGKVAYLVEGVTYFLQPWDILLVQHNLIHRPIIDPAQPYERIVIWLGRDWLAARSDPGEPLDACFDAARRRGFHLLRAPGERRLQYMGTIQRLEEALHSTEFGAARLADTLCQQLLIGVNRDILRDRTAQEERDSYRADPKIEEILRHIAANLDGDLTVDTLARRFYLSRYYLMHRFKAVTGYTIHQYISHKRLLRAGELIRAGTPVMKAAEQVGFSEYSTFLRAFRNTFHMNPREFR
nr:AraC family transcriptional regulator [uncultured Oscillibacter sp.]